MADPMTLDDVATNLKNFTGPAGDHAKADFQKLQDAVTHASGTPDKDDIAYMKAKADAFAKDMAEIAEGFKNPKNQEALNNLKVMAGGKDIEHHTGGQLLGDFRDAVTDAVKTTTKGAVDISAAPAAQTQTQTQGQHTDYDSKLQLLQKISPAAAETFQDLAILNTLPQSAERDAAIQETRKLLGTQVLASKVVARSADELKEYDKNFAEFMGDNKTNGLAAIYNSALNVFDKATSTAPGAAQIVPQNELSSGFKDEIAKLKLFDQVHHTNAADTLLAIERLKIEPQDKSSEQKQVEAEKGVTLNKELDLLKKQLGTGTDAATADQLFKEAQESLKNAGVSSGQTPGAPPAPPPGGRGQPQQGQGQQH